MSRAESSITNFLDEPDPLAAIRDRRGDVEQLAGRDDRFGALARVLLSLADGDVPDESDCQQAHVTSLAALTGGSR